MSVPVLDHDLDLTEFRSSVRAFAEAEILPGAAERDASARFPADLVRRLADQDLMGISVPTEYGGLGLSTRAQLVAIEEVARADAALASIYTAHYLGLEPILVGGTEEQRARRLPALATGEQLAGFALTEPDAGSDIASMRTVARRAADGWHLSGAKTFISNAREADLVVLFAKTDPDAGFRGITAFAVPKGTPGITYSEPQDKLGIRSAPTYTVYLDDVVLPHDAVIGTEGRGGNIALTALNRARIDVAAMANGIALRAWELGRRYAAERKQFGHPIAEFQAIQLLLGACDAELVAARVTADWAADVKDAGQDLRRAASISKYTATEACFAIVDRVVQIHGGAGFMRESEIERLYRDCRILRIFEGTSQIQLLTIAGNAPSIRSYDY
ncbi:acyl-CoA dehydrogenase family protein [Nocardia farcinica]|uniref:Acyl-CoA dehydrogenase, short-chain specific n=1 Tax=Nocardia farcinica TaxID=37329 RepID=A0A449GPK7_NOCFR|nr:acyl-CoA dehydrogenase family protein [Nocardia farcinica]MBA4854998.1 acyl-CoA dehydrogenase family protein [Nocardia farcinica]MBC9816004.1 acyl-CoA dehydrogenase family protein [Nocardia farcinica]MBF6068420.1 acyl-CoA dehydrogenase family protein [Nocardia farcinica]MBF6442340.1 acyl-CoA dehydrogenase family protein [Nocardia farcinica]MBF6519240.1 acyl-CoA dehydrogenase family protein [Nocardia farcinica]